MGKITMFSKLRNIFHLGSLQQTAGNPVNSVGTLTIQSLQTASQYPANFREVDDFLLRSSMPSDVELYYIRKKHNLTDVINLSNNAPAQYQMLEENAIYKSGLNYHKLPTVTDNPLIENIQKFLDIMKSVKEKRGKALVHCNAGIDRTGTFVVFYELANKLKDFDGAIRGMLEMGHWPDDYPKLQGRILKIARQMKFIK